MTRETLYIQEMNNALGDGTKRVQRAFQWKEIREESGDQAMKGFGRILSMMGKYKSSFSREGVELDLLFEKVILLNITNDWTDSTPNYNEVPLHISQNDPHSKVCQ